MRSAIEETEDIFGLFLIFGLVGLVAFLISNRQAILDFLLGSAGSATVLSMLAVWENLKRWKQNIVGSGDDSGDGPTITYLTPEALPSPVDPYKLESPNKAAAQYSLMDTSGLNLAGYGQVQDPSAVLPDGGAVFQWLQSKKVF